MAAPALGECRHRRFARRLTLESGALSTVTVITNVGAEVMIAVSKTAAVDEADRELTADELELIAEGTTGHYGAVIQAGWNLAQNKKAA